MYLRYESCVPNFRGFFPGVYALANGLARAGKLRESEYQQWKETNQLLDRAYLAPEIYIQLPDDALTSWYIENSAPHLLDSMEFYTDLLDAYEVPWREVRSANPGEIVYRDDVQIVVRPFSHEKYWAL
ncbi:MAG: hypothetical protein Q3974_01535 [Rothia sp. (in: high G+C Gram-positive bacteria)]|nr:hypothetical protein [Rothia sp. (in: high G+C Gram-positive bacteria)]